MDTDTEKEKEIGKENKHEFEERNESKEKPEDVLAEWADALHLEYDPEEARRRAEKASTPPTPPPAPIINPAPTPAPFPFNQQPPAPNATASAPQEPMPDTYLIWSVFATVLCCLIPGVVAIVYSTMVSSKYYAKDYEGARRASEKAQYWIIASVVLGVITAAVYIPLSLFA